MLLTTTYSAGFSSSYHRGFLYNHLDLKKLPRRYSADRMPLNSSRSETTDAEISALDSSSSTHAPVGLKVEGLRVQFGQQQNPVLNDLNLNIEPGEIIALVGASGCGKSTLLRTIAGLQSYLSGKIQYWRNSVNQVGGNQVGGNQVNCAFVFQDATLLPWRTVVENVQLPFELRRGGKARLSSTEINQRVAGALRSVSLNEEHWNLFPRQLSGGMRMRTSIARALVTDPSLLLLDEPFAALDDILRTRLNQLLLELWVAQHRTILFVTHNIAEAVMLSHKIAVVASGKIHELIPNPLPWPRDASQRTSVPFAQLYSRISQALSDAAIDNEGKAN